MVELGAEGAETLAAFARTVHSTTPEGEPSSPMGLVEQALGGEAGSRMLIMQGLDERQRRMHVHAAPVHNAADEIVGTVIVARDLTAIHDTIVERSRLDGAIKTARLVAHQLNNQLSLLTGYGELLQGEVEGEAADFARGIVRGAMASAATIARLQRIIRFEETEGGADYPMLDLEASTTPRES